MVIRCLILLRNKREYELVEVLPLYFELLHTTEDKGLRSMVFGHVVKDILGMNKQTQDMNKNRELQRFLFDQLSGCSKVVSGNTLSGSTVGGGSSSSSSMVVHKAAGKHKVNAEKESVSRKALIILITLYKKGTWTSATLVNQVAQCCLARDTHAAKAAINLILGNAS